MRWQGSGNIEIHARHAREVHATSGRDKDSRGTFSSPVPCLVDLKPFCTNYQISLAKRRALSRIATLMMKAVMIAVSSEIIETNFPTSVRRNQMLSDAVSLVMMRSLTLPVVHEKYFSSSELAWSAVALQA